ncbi:hypothetical protein ABB37_09706 [Leptomonas pyrrhocoris]|uniref:Uncharacterized protein n=1 Tax=Leptomonas pyrrhocoris TaxID=157538 RepID=A0A0N1J470_LEPPY|nr:hypothetical protein ABB37_09706 [Leptomonas pyrrhocoris]KPA73574.1 hypothetical protein ABB37_09706 [Leptomonas pyrrhocoris]|eukprot:XP_015652013.1 hypothetical protein ABB37_09706 [Leptomonas pyrrhocoris]
MSCLRAVMQHRLDPRELAVGSRAGTPGPTVPVRPRVAGAWPSGDGAAYDAGVRAACDQR